MNTSQLIRSVFNRRFLKYFLITLGVVVLVSGIGFCEHYLDRFIENKISVGTSLGLWVLVVISMLPNSVSLSFCLASFLSFRKIPQEAGIKDFLKILGIGMIVTLVIAGGIYAYDRHVAPGLKAQLSEKMYYMYSPYPGRIGTVPVSETRISFQNISPSTSTQKVLTLRNDSLSERYNGLRNDCIQQLRTLPDTLASQAYRSYELRRAGLSYVHAQEPYIEENEETYNIIIRDLYNYAVSLYETQNELLKYRREAVARRVNAIGLVICFVLYGSAGFFLRHRSIKLILGVIAALVLLGYIFTFIQKQTTAFVENQVHLIRDYNRNSPQ